MLVNGLEYKKEYEEHEFIHSDNYEHGKILLVKRNMPDRKDEQALVLFIEGELETSSRLMGYDFRKGVKISFKKEDILGTIRPECISDYDRMYISSYKPFVDELPSKGEELGFTAYCYLKNERYRGPVFINTEKELHDYVGFQLKYQYMIRICDRDDYIIMETKEGNLVYPSR